MATIIQQGNTVLRKKADAVVLSDINTPKIKKILKDMSVALRKESDGVAIAAPQIGVSKRIFIISGHVFDKSFRSERGSVKKDYTTPDVVFINPEFVKKSKTKKWLEEGCLSVRPIYGEVERSTQATVRAYDENGKKFTRGGSGLIAHIFQHEIDHLDGILFIDKARNIKKQEITKNGA